MEYRLFNPSTHPSHSCFILGVQLCTEYTSSTVNYFCKKASILDVHLGYEYASGTVN